MKEEILGYLLIKKILNFLLVIAVFKHIFELLWGLQNVIHILVCQSVTSWWNPDYHTSISRGYPELSYDPNSLNISGVIRELALEETFHWILPRISPLSTLDIWFFLSRKFADSLTLSAFPLTPSSPLCVDIINGSPLTALQTLIGVEIRTHGMHFILRMEENKKDGKRFSVPEFSQRTTDTFARPHFVPVEVVAVAAKSFLSHTSQG